MKHVGDAVNTDVMSSYRCDEHVGDAVNTDVMSSYRCDEACWRCCQYRCDVVVQV